MLKFEKHSHWNWVLNALTRLKWLKINFSVIEHYNQNQASLYNSVIRILPRGKTAVLSVDKNPNLTLKKKKIHSRLVIIDYKAIIQNTITTG